MTDLDILTILNALPPKDAQISKILYSNKDYEQLLHLLNIIVKEDDILLQKKWAETQEIHINDEILEIFRLIDYVTNKINILYGE